MEVTQETRLSHSDTTYDQTAWQEPQESVQLGQAVTAVLHNGQACGDANMVNPTQTVYVVTQDVLQAIQDRLTQVEGTVYKQNLAQRQLAQMHFDYERITKEMGTIKEQMAHELEDMRYRKAALSNKLRECSLMKNVLTKELKEVRSMKKLMEEKAEKMIGKEEELAKTIEDYKKKMVNMDNPQGVEPEPMSESSMGEPGVATAVPDNGTTPSGAVAKTEGPAQSPDERPLEVRIIPRSSNSKKAVDLDKLRQRLKSTYKKKDEELDDEVAAINGCQRKCTRMSRAQMTAYVSAARFQAQLSRRTGLLTSEADYRREVDSSEMMSINCMLKKMKLQTKRTVNTERLRRAVQKAHQSAEAAASFDITRGRSAVTCQLPEEEDSDDDL